MSPEGTAPVYDDIGAGYTRFRRADPRIEATVHAALGDARRVVNVGAGAGSYEPVDHTVVAVEPSPEMIRQRPASAAPCVRADAAALPFPDDGFDAAMAILTVHHWPDPVAGLRELRRVAEGVVLLGFEPLGHRDFWLFRDYVPAVTTLPSVADALSVQEAAELVEADRIETVPIPHDCLDGFGCAYWRRPEAYLDPDVRRCISGFGLLDPDDVLPGIERLREDLESGRWQAEHAELLDLDELDCGFRLVVRDPP
ncbi:MAG TPA: class I SAM-dependent methyltransferase [Acidimicrobiales bacterium]|nr:class I SAM-dependent methyltransferase [Acidimicrobiales bacterium]